ncbi:MAG: hypothetical protein CR977_01710 [Gammaproteobacteria bacterium]|nr:MAG: hypothetical protein CR977_01710 [Gammaproteobacteria bacterium]
MNIRSDLKHRCIQKFNAVNSRTIGIVFGDFFNTFVDLIIFKPFVLLLLALYFGKINTKGCSEFNQTRVVNRFI